jgi:hypothetical protein
MNIFFRSFALTALGMVLVSGCGTPRPRAASITILPKTTSSVPVDLVGVTDENLENFMGYDVDNYWRPHDPVRFAAEKFEVQISGGRATPSELLATAPIWAKWIGSGVTHLVIVADLRGDDFKGLGRLDPRRTDIYLKDRFASNSIIVEIQDKAVKVITPKKH